MSSETSKLVRSYRTRYGHTQRFYAEQMGISPQYLNDIENGRLSVSWKSMSLLARGLGIPIERMVRAKIVEELAHLDPDHLGSLHVTVESNGVSVEAMDAAQSAPPDAAEVSA